MTSTPKQLAKSQAAFENNWKDFWEEPEMVFPKHSRGTYANPTHYIEFQKWQAAEAFGRKQTLEDSIAICKDFKGGGINGIQAALVCAYNIGELLK